MTTNLLCTVSEDPNMFNGLHFLCRFFENKDNLKLTLLCMAAPDSQYCRWEAGSNNGKAKTLPNDLDQNWKSAQDAALRMLQGDGFKPEDISIKNSSSMICRMEDIEQEIGNEPYDAVVMGRRGLNRLKGFLWQKHFAQTACKSPGNPLWLCRKPDFNRRNVLLCVDGSDSAYSMARYLGKDARW